MKKLVQINVVCNGSTGKIMCDIAQAAQKNSYEVYCFFGRGSKNKNINCEKIENSLSIYWHAFLARIGFNGHGSYFATKKLVKKLKTINPDIIHLHNIHGYYLNLKVLFKYLKKHYKGKLVWTLHDCWAFTGHCSYFTAINCNKWQRKCRNCPQLNVYPKEMLDTTKREYFLKKKLFTGLSNLALVTPSMWLKKIVQKSILKEYSIIAIYNGIDFEKFKPTIDEAIYKKYNIPKNKKILLGVASVWEKRKGLNVFLELSRLLSDDEIIVLIGLNDAQISKMPMNIIGIKRTENVQDIVNIYSISSAFINPSVEETFSLVTVEAMACGLPVVVCGMSAPKELINKKYGRVINKNDAANYYKAYKELIKNDIDSNEIVKYARKFDIQEMIKKYLELYEEK